MALTFGYYVNEDAARPLAVAAVVVFTAINALGVTKTARAATILVIIVIASLAVPVLSVVGLDHVDSARVLPDGRPPGGLGVLEAAALLFFAFAGYARIATLGEEVVEPERTIPRAISIAFAIALSIYAVVICAAMIALTPEGLAASPAPLVAVVQVAGHESFEPIVRAGAAVASLGVLLSLLAGVSRTAFAMARERDLPGWLDAVHPRYRVPHRAEIVAGAIVAILAARLDLREAIDFSSFAILTYYAIANASAWTLRPAECRWPQWLAVGGIIGCVALAVSLSWEAIAAGIVCLAIGAVLFAVRSRGR